MHVLSDAYLAMTTREALRLPGGPSGCEWPTNYVTRAVGWGGSTKGGKCEQNIPRRYQSRRRRSQVCRQASRFSPWSAFALFLACCVSEFKVAGRQCFQWGTADEESRPKGCSYSPGEGRCQKAFRLAESRDGRCRPQANSAALSYERFAEVKRLREPTRGFEYHATEELRQRQR
jgi:hypothetical protein